MNGFEHWLGPSSHRPSLSHIIMAANDKIEALILKLESETITGERNRRDYVYLAGLISPLKQALALVPAPAAPVTGAAAAPAPGAILAGLLSASLKSLKLFLAGLYVLGDRVDSLDLWNRFLAEAPALESFEGVNWGDVNIADLKAQIEAFMPKIAAVRKTETTWMRAPVVSGAVAKAPRRGRPRFGPGNSGPASSAPRPQSGACHICREEGHWAPDCPSRRQQPYASSSAAPASAPQYSAPRGRGTFPRRSFRRNY